MSLRVLFTVGFAAVTAIGAAGAAMAQDDEVGAISAGKDKIQVSGSGHQRSFPCDGRRVVIEGTENVITLTGVCSGLQVSGTNNSVTIELAPKAPLIVEGVENRVRWQSSGEPKRSVSGVKNQVTRVPARG